MYVFPPDNIVKRAPKPFEESGDVTKCFPYHLINKNIFRISNVLRNYERNLSTYNILVNTVPVHGIELLCDRPSAGTMLHMKS